MSEFSSAEILILNLLAQQRGKQPSRDQVEIAKALSGETPDYVDPEPETAFSAEALREIEFWSDKVNAKLPKGD